jgi:hypothetical protein
MHVSGTQLPSSLLHVCMIVRRNRLMPKRHCRACHLLILLTSSTQLFGLIMCTHNHLHPHSCSHNCMLLFNHYALDPLAIHWLHKHTAQRQAIECQQLIIACGVWDSGCRGVPQSIMRQQQVASWHLCSTTTSSCKNRIAHNIVNIHTYCQHTAHSTHSAKYIM